MRYMSLVLVVAGLSLATVACTDKTSHPGAAANSPSSEAVPAAKAVPATSLAKAVAKAGAGRDRAALARVFSLSRCVMIGVLSADPKHYSANGFADDAAFRTAFLAESQIDVMWARGVVDKATHTPCRGLPVSGNAARKVQAEKKP